MFKIKSFVLLSITLGLGFVLPAFSSGEMKSNDNIIENIFSLIYNQQFEEAEKMLAFSKNRLDSKNYLVLNHDLLWWKAIVKNDEGNFKMLEKKLIASFEELEKLSNRNKFEELVCLNYLFRLATLQKQPLKMVQYFFKINKIIEQSDSKGLTIENMDVFNLYKAIFLFGKGKILFSNSKIQEESLNTLRSYLISPNLVNRTIANYFLAKIYNEFEKSPESAKPYLEELCKLYPNNMIFKIDFNLCNNKNRF